MGTPCFAHPTLKSVPFIGRVGISSLLLFYQCEMTDEYCPPTETLAVGSAQNDLSSASLNAQKHCPPYTKDLLIALLDSPKL